MTVRRWSPRSAARGQDGYILLLVLLVLIVVGMMAATLLAAVNVNQQHVSRDRDYSQSLAVAEAGLNQYLWMVYAGTSSEANDFAIPGNTESNVHKETVALANPDSAVSGTYTILVSPPSGGDPRIGVTVTGLADSGTDLDRTISAHIGRPSFSEYILLVDDQVSIGGAPADPHRVWHGKTHSNTGIRIETDNIDDTVTCAQSTYSYGGTTEPGVWSQYVATSPLWKFPVPPVDFGTVTSDFVRLSGKATHSGVDNLVYVTPSPSTAAHGWYIKLLPNKKYQIAKVTAESENKNYANGNNRGGYLTYGTLSAQLDYPANGIIFVNDNVWVEGTGLSGRLTIACSGQLNPSGQQAATSINIVGDITYAAYDGSVAVGLIAQNNVKIPMYAPMGKAGTMGTSLTSPGTIDMRIDGALIAQQGAEYVSYDTSSNPWGPCRRTLTFFGSVSSKAYPYRYTFNGNTYAGFAIGVNTYDRFLLHTPPPFFPTIGSYQILDWQELPSTQAVTPTP